ncbi:oligosaccharide flippase family protein [Lacihabitans sp. CS3-21]|uniref:oligosaccharide flippase family protein n=1 Tax=Lacihabitans sp. CS3-21 TaxID=2487332 RepID=UPI0020CDAB9B|nr:oligosaccharide flippase family protein [Lacihabitans sp. CS3-21]MCP9747565.1 hypothetical protein [Lacihabitans sp. CS3-21]
MKSDFLRNSLLLISGTSMAQFIPIVFSPILTRIYSPSEFGNLGLFIAINAVLCIFSTGLYEMAILNPKEDSNAINIYSLLILCSFCFSSLIFLFILLYSYFPFLGLRLFENIFLLPISIFFTGIFQALGYWLTRKKQFNVINYSKVSQSLALVAISILLGSFGFKKNGLVIGFVIGNVVAVWPLINTFISFSSYLNWENMLSVGKKYIDYPKIVMPTSLMNTLASQAPVFFISKYYNSQIVGSYSFANRTLTAPTSVISVAIGQIYFSNVSEISNSETLNLFPAFLKTTKILLLCSFALFTPIFFFGAEIFTVIFGKDWVSAGEYVEIISIGAFIKFIVSPLSTIFLATNNLKTLAGWQTSYFIVSIIVFSCGIFFSIKCLLWLYVAHEVILYSIYFVLMLKVIKVFDSNLKKNE